MITYESCCKKLGFDVIADFVDLFPNMPDHEDDSIPSPFAVLTPEELDVYVDYLMEHRAELDKYNGYGWSRK